MHAAVGALIEDVIVVEKLQRLDAQRLVETLATAVDIVAVGRDAAMVGTGHDELEDVSEQVHLRADRLCGIVKRGVGVVAEVNLTIDVAPPDHVLVHPLLGGERYLRPHRHIVAVAGGLRFLLLPGLGLSLGKAGRQTGAHNQEQYFSHSFIVLALMSCISNYLTFTSMAPGKVRVMPSGPVARTSVI